MNSTHEPTVQVIAAIIFAVALVHTFAARQFERLAHRYPKHAGLFHLLGEVEVVFGFWAIVLVAAMALISGGDSALAYAESLKIDRSFVDGVDTDPMRQSLLRAIVDMGHSLRLQVTAEGVETAGEMAVLRQAGCDLAQGYLVARPMATEALEAWRLAHVAAAVEIA